MNPFFWEGQYHLTFERADVGVNLYYVHFGGLPVGIQRKQFLSNRSSLSFYFFGHTQVHIQTAIMLYGEIPNGPFALGRAGPLTTTRERSLCLSLYLIR